MSQEERYREYIAERLDRADVEIPVEVGDSVLAHQISGIYDWMLEGVGGYPVEGRVRGIRAGTEGCRNLSCEVVVRVRFEEADIDGAVYCGTTEVYPLGGTRHSWDESPLEVPDE